MANATEKTVKTPAEVIAETLKSLNRGGESVTKSAATVEREARHARIVASLNEVAKELVVETEGTTDQDNLATAIRRIALVGDYAKKALAGVPDEALATEDVAGL